MIGDPQAWAVRSLDCHFSGRTLPGSRDFDKGGEMWRWSRSESATGCVSVPFKRMGRKAERRSDAGDGQHGGECDSLGPQGLGDAPARCGTALAPLGQLVR